MNIFIYSDESGVFDVTHNKIYVFAGVVFLSKEKRDVAARKYIAAEKVIYNREGISKSDELKASVVSNSSKGKLYRSLNNEYKFAVVIDQEKVNKNIFASKKDKQRFLDYAYKIGVKRLFQDLIRRGLIKPKEVENLYFYVDEHTTATNGRYELRESLEQEFKFGTYNHNYVKYYPPIFTGLNSVSVDFCNSSSKTLIRAADIIANNVYYKANRGTEESNENLIITYLP